MLNQLGWFGKYVFKKIFFFCHHVLDTGFRFQFNLTRRIETVPDSWVPLCFLEMTLFLGFQVFISFDKINYFKK